ncbi:Polyisoprenyl-teichoic acid--peptidoglycan teichoic acid transferase TagV [Anaerolineales bacterium]|nr:Polyisoprenyl-teichoic acid--peptidoglycan teichoic acid transferase TagV [Anaerolineales bacterium]
MKNKQKSILVVLTVFACAAAALSYYYASQAVQVWIQKPLGPVLESSTPGQRQLPATWTAPPSAPPLSTITLAPTLNFETNTPSKLPPCYGLPPMTILAIGTDQRSDDYKYGRADAIRVIRADYIARRVSVLEFPRDLWVEIPEISDNLNQDHDKLNTAYFYGNPGLHYWDHPSEGPGLLARTLELNFGMKVDHYVAVSMDVFVDLVDAIGGIDITLAEEVDGRTAGDRSKRLYFPAGDQHLNGEQALTLGRIRNVSVFSRAEHQNLVICAVRKKLESPEALIQLPQIISSFKDHIQTDLTPAQISQLACLGTSVPRGNILFASFPLELFKPDEVYHSLLKQDVFIWDADFNEITRYVEQFNTGSWPQPSASTEPDPGTSDCE